MEEVSAQEHQATDQKVGISEAAHDLCQFGPYLFEVRVKQRRGHLSRYFSYRKYHGKHLERPVYRRFVEKYPPERPLVEYSQ
jgi:hypothetical protein